MNIINILSNETIGKISSGEFLNRPCDILKELIENSIDAKASIIRIDILNGGLDLIKVSDNGIGICKKDLFNSVKKHYTSKICSFNDLNNLNSFGFRGESLSCISIISDFKISSRIILDKYGWSLFNNIYNTSFFNIKPIFHFVGTSVEVKNIYFNLHKKRKLLLCNIYYEWILIKKLINLFVISNPNIRYLIYLNGKLFKDYYSSNNYKEITISRISDIYGKKKINCENYVSILEDLFSLKGYFFSVSSNRNIKIIFINKRIIDNSNLLFYIIDKVFFDLFEKKISYIFFFEIKNIYININISPRKNLIEFNDSIIIYNLIYKYIFLYFKEKKNIFLIKKKKINCEKKKIISYKFNENFFNFVKKGDFLHYFLEKFGNIICIIDNRFVYSCINKNIIISDILYIYYYYNVFIFKKKMFFLIKVKKLDKVIKLNNIYNITNINYLLDILLKLGIYINYNTNYIVIYKVPLFFNNENLIKLFNKFFNYLSNNIIITKRKIIYLLSDFIIYNDSSLDRFKCLSLISCFHKMMVFYKFYKNVFKILNLEEFSVFLSLYL